MDIKTCTNIIISYLLTCIDIKYFYPMDWNNEIRWKEPGIEEVIDK